MSRYLVDGASGHEYMDDVDIVPAFNAQGSIIFQRFESLAELGEGGMRSLWTTYLMSLVGNHLVNNYKVKSDIRHLDRLLRNSGLRMSSPEPKSVWANITDKLRQILQTGSAEGSLSFTQDGMPLVSGKISLTPTTQEGWPSPSDLDLMIQISSSILAKLGRRCWVILDRLDEAFQHDAELERLALRALLRAHLDLASYGRELRSKLFLRTELIDRVTKNSGFVNATHLRTQQIRWTSDDILNMISLRILSNTELCSAFGLLTASPANPADRLKACSVVLPAVIDNDHVLSWLVKHTVDGSGAPNPRNVITLLRVARSVELRVCERDDVSISRYGALIGPGSMKAGGDELSRRRLSDTLLAEFPNIQPYVEKLRGVAVTWHDASTLCRHLGLPRTDMAVIDELIYSGFIRRDEGGTFSLPLLYRPALRLPPALTHSARKPLKGRTTVSRRASEMTGAESLEALIEPIRGTRRQRRGRRNETGEAEKEPPIETTYEETPVEADAFRDRNSDEAYDQIDSESAVEFKKSLLNPFRAQENDENEISPGIPEE